MKTIIWLNISIETGIENGIYNNNKNNNNNNINIEFINKSTDC